MHINGQMTADRYLIAVVIHVEILVLTIECVNKVLFPEFFTGCDPYMEPSQYNQILVDHGNDTRIKCKLSSPLQMYDPDHRTQKLKYLSLHLYGSCSS